MPAHRPPRADLDDVAESTKELVDRFVAARRDGRVSAGAGDVVMAVVKLLTGFRRLEDEASRKQIADEAGISERQASRYLKELADGGVIGWWPGGNGRASKVALSPGSETSPCPATSETSPCPATPATDGSSETSSETSSGTSPCPTPIEAAAAAAHDERLRRLAGVYAREETRKRAAIATPTRPAFRKTPDDYRRAVKRRFLDRHAPMDLVGILEDNPSASDDELLHALEPENWPEPRPAVELDLPPAPTDEQRAESRRRIDDIRRDVRASA